LFSRDFACCSPTARQHNYSSARKIQAKSFPRPAAMTFCLLMLSPVEKDIIKNLGGQAGLGRKPDN
jgi:hypothetical protein